MKNIPAIIPQPNLANVNEGHLQKYLFPKMIFPMKVVNRICLMQINKSQNDSSQETRQA